jgi:hypothetical protein
MRDMGSRPASNQGRPADCAPRRITGTVPLRGHVR